MFSLSHCMQGRARVAAALGLFSWICLLVSCRVVEPLSPKDAGVSHFDAAPSEGCGLQKSSDAARGVLWLANHANPVELQAELPLGPGLSPSQSEQLLQARPIDDLAVLESVMSAGCDALIEMACQRLGRCHAPVDLLTWNLKTFPLSQVTSLVVADTLRELEADVIGLQEISDASAFYDLRDAMPEFDGFVGNKGPYTRVAILFRKARLDVVEIEDLFDEDWYSFPRPPLAVTFSLADAEQPALFTVVVVHLKAMLDQESRDRRISAMEKLEAWTRAQENRAIFLLGDFNDTLDDEVEQDIFAPFRGPDYGLLTEAISFVGAFSYIPFQKLIDHTLATREALQLLPAAGVRAQPLEESVMNYVDLVSDHRPITSELWPILPDPSFDSRLSQIPW